MRLKDGGFMVNKQLQTTNNLIVQDNIKSEFYIYFLEINYHKIFMVRPKYKFCINWRESNYVSSYVLKPKYSFIFAQQTEKIEAIYGTFKECTNSNYNQHCPNFFNEIISIPNLPQKFFPKIEKIDENIFKDKWIDLNDFSFNKIVLKESIISYLTQRGELIKQEIEDIKKKYEEHNKRWQWDKSPQSSNYRFHIVEDYNGACQCEDEWKKINLLLKLFVSLNQYINGIDFDDYIDNWIKYLLRRK